LPDWIVERGIGEVRAALVEGERILEARILPDGVLPAGSVVEARLASIGSHGRNAVALAVDGTELLLPRRPAGVAEGASIRVEITREAIPGIEPWKRPLARITDAPPALATLPGRPARPGEFDAAGWPDLLDEAASGEVSFPGGSLSIHLTPAMTLIDVDGHLAPETLAEAGALAAGRAIRRLGIGGSIGIDLPTVAGKAARTAAAEALDRALAGTPFERTAVNGFGFVQVVRPRRHASQLEIYAGDRASAEARALLRRASGRIGATRLAAHPSVTAVLERHPAWLDALARQVGGAVTLRADPALAISGGHAEPV
jgi:hypothetical protein